MNQARVELALGEQQPGWSDGLSQCERWAGRRGETGFGGPFAMSPHPLPLETLRDLMLTYLNPVQRASGTQDRPLHPAVPFQDLNRRAGRVTYPPEPQFPYLSNEENKGDLAV